MDRVRCGGERGRGNNNNRGWDVIGEGAWATLDGICRGTNREVGWADGNGWYRGTNGTRWWWADGLGGEGAV